MHHAIFTLPRQFQMWEYVVGHKQLLLRSTKGEETPTRIDVLFKNVIEINLRTALDGLAVSEATTEELSEMHIQSDLLRGMGKTVFVARDSTFSGYVIASVVAWHEDEREYYEPSHWFLKPGI